MGRLSKCTALLPITYNNGLVISDDIQINILKDISDEFGGYTVIEKVIGQWGEQKEELLLVVVAVEPDKVSLLSDMIRNHGYRTKQVCMYFEVIPDCVELLDSTYAEFFKAHGLETDNVQ